MLPDFIKEPSDLAKYNVYIELIAPWSDVGIDFELSYENKDEAFLLMQHYDVSVAGFCLCINLKVHEDIE